MLVRQRTVDVAKAPVDCEEHPERWVPIAQDVFLIDVHGESTSWMDGLKAEGIAYEVARTAIVPGGRVWLCCHGATDEINEYCRVH